MLIPITVITDIWPILSLLAGLFLIIEAVLRTARNGDPLPRQQVDEQVEKLVHCVFAQCWVVEFIKHSSITMHWTLFSTLNVFSLWGAVYLFMFPGFAFSKPPALFKFPSLQLVRWFVSKPVELLPHITVGGSCFAAFSSASSASSSSSFIAPIHNTPVLTTSVLTTSVLMTSILTTIANHHTDSLHINCGSQLQGLANLFSSDKVS